MNLRTLRLSLTPTHAELHRRGLQSGRGRKPPVTGLTQSEMAYRLNVSVCWLRMLESGKVMPGPIVGNAINQLREQSKCTK